MSIAPGETISHYRLIEKIGEGGMGVVYRAHDTRLERNVALKVLMPGLLDNEASRKRFRKEALALSKLNHSNIAVVHDFDTQDGIDFLVMELVPGQSLAQKLRSGALPEAELASLGMQIASALEEAHEHGVIHRDLKPGNIMVTPRGRAKVLDFGLAKVLPPAGSPSLADTVTQTQATVGTPPYMAPEQLLGEIADARTDIWALGTVLYEMATGKRPFRGETPTQLSNAILHHPPTKLRDLNAGLSPGLERVITKCLEKQREHRYHTANEIEMDLQEHGATREVIASIGAPLRSKRWFHVLMAVFVIAIATVIIYRMLDTERTSIPEPESRRVILAVLPFENLSPNPEEWFSDGMTEEMISQLGQLRPDHLGVIARTSAMHFKNTDKRISAIGIELGVDYILEGSVRRVDEQVRVTAQLIHVTDETQFWAETYDGELTDIFGIQSDVARRIAQSLTLELLPAQEAKLTTPREVDPAAHETYLMGRYYWNKRGEDNLKKSLDYFKQAITIDPEYALGYVGLADAYLVLSEGYYLSPRESIPKAKSAAVKALELDESLAEGHNSLAAIRTYHDWDWAGAEEEYQRAIELNPNNATAHQWYGELLSYLGRFDEAIAESRRAQALDPVSLITNTLVAIVLYRAQHYEQALEQFRKTLEMDPDFLLARIYYGQTYLRLGMHEKGSSELQRALTVQRHPSILGALGHAYAIAGRREAAQEILDEMISASGKGYVSPYYMAVVHLGLGESDEALDWLEKACDERNVAVPRLKIDPRFSNLHSTPRFKDLLRRIGLPTD